MFYAMCEPGDIEDKTTLNCYGVDCPYCYGALHTIDRQVRLQAYGDASVTFAKAVVDTALTLGANYDAIKRMFVDWLRGSRDLGGLSTKRGTHMYSRRRSSEASCRVSSTYPPSIPRMCRTCTSDMP